MAWNICLTSYACEWTDGLFPSFQSHGRCIWPSYHCRQSLLLSWTASVEQSLQASLQATRHCRCSVHYGQLHHFSCRWWPRLYEYVLCLLRRKLHSFRFGIPQEIWGACSFCLLQAVCMIVAQIRRCPAVLVAGLEQTEEKMPCSQANPVSPAESTEPARSPAGLEPQRRVFPILFAKRQ